MNKIILASASPRRKELLQRIGLRFEVEPSNCEEFHDPKLKPHDLAKSLSAKKAQAVAKNRKNATIIAADTLIVLDNTIMGKPVTEAKAQEMLQRLSGRCHLVVTGFTILDTVSKKVRSGSTETKVYIKHMTSEEIDSYVQSKEPLDKAGAYAIQELGSVIVERIEGDFFNVVGLPLNALSECLKDFDIHVLKGSR